MAQHLATASGTAVQWSLDESFPLVFPCRIDLGGDTRLHSAAGCADYYAHSIYFIKDLNPLLDFYDSFCNLLLFHLEMVQLFLQTQV